MGWAEGLLPYPYVDVFLGGHVKDQSSILSVRTRTGNHSKYTGTYIDLLRLATSDSAGGYSVMTERVRLIAAIPAYNEEGTIAKLVVRALRHVDRVVVVDDGSTDDTGLIAKKLGAVVVMHQRNLGKGAALRTCLNYGREVGAEVLVTLDADGQHDPDEILAVASPVVKGEADITVGSRRYASEVPRLRRLGARLLDRATDVRSGGLVVDAQSGFRAYSRKALELVSVAEYGMGADSQILMSAKDAGLRITEVPVGVRYQGLTTSTHNPVYHALDVFFSVVKFVSIRHPLLFYGGFSAIMFMVALIFGIQTIDYYQRWGRVITNLALISFASGIMALLSFFTGVILFTLITVLRQKE